MEPEYWHKCFHRITERLELEETFEDHLVQRPAMDRHSLDLVAHRPIQHKLEHFQ